MNFTTDSDRDFSRTCCQEQKKNKTKKLLNASISFSNESYQRMPVAVLHKQPARPPVAKLHCSSTCALDEPIAQNNTNNTTTARDDDDDDTRLADSGRLCESNNKN